MASAAVLGPVFELQLQLNPLLPRRLVVALRVGYRQADEPYGVGRGVGHVLQELLGQRQNVVLRLQGMGLREAPGDLLEVAVLHFQRERDRKSTRLNSSHANISYAVFCLKKKKNYYIIILCINS